MDGLLDGLSVSFSLVSAPFSYLSEEGWCGWWLLVGIVEGELRRPPMSESLGGGCVLGETCEDSESWRMCETLSGGGWGGGDERRVIVGVLLVLAGFVESAGRLVEEEVRDSFLSEDLGELWLNLLEGRGERSRFFFSNASSFKLLDCRLWVVTTKRGRRRDREI